MNSVPLLHLPSKTHSNTHGSHASHVSSNNGGVAGKVIEAPTTENIATSATHIPTETNTNVSISGEKNVTGNAINDTAIAPSTIGIGAIGLGVAGAAYVHKKKKK